MALTCNYPDDFRIGSIGKVIDGVEAKISEQGELLCKAPGFAAGYYKNTEKTAETFVDGWLHTGDKARMDEDGFIFLIGRISDHFKTIHDKYVAPSPIEGAFTDNENVEQVCLLGSGYSKTVMVCVLTEIASNKSQSILEASLKERMQLVNDSVEKHERIGAVIATTAIWTIDNGVLTPTLKIKRDVINERFGRRAEALARQSAEQGKLLVEFA